MGSALAGWAEGKIGSAPALSKTQAIESFAPYHDFLGNLDGVVIGHLNRNTPNSVKLSTVVEKYYTKEWNRRAADFLRFMGWAHSGCRVHAEARDIIKQQVEVFAKGTFIKAHPLYLFKSLPWSEDDRDWYGQARCRVQP